MNFWIFILGFVLLTSIVITGILIPRILLISFRRKLFDVPDERKIHHGVVPRLGGIAFMPAIIFGIGLAAGLDTFLSDGCVCKALYDESLPICFGICGMLLLYLVGIADDLIGVKYRAKFFVQIGTALFFIGAGLWLNNVYGLLWLHELPTVIGYLLTILIVVFIVNAFNLIDGIDGLCSGLSSIALIVYGILFFLNYEYVYAMVAFATLGTLIPFFYYNVFGNPAMGKKIFMGDTGSLTIGMILCFLAMAACRLNLHANIHSDINPFVLAFSPLIVPCFDVVRVFIHRLRRHVSPFLPDKSHIHHKLLALGLNQRLCMISILLLSAVYTAINIAVSPFINVTLLVVIDIVLFIVGNMALTKAIRRYEKRKQIQCTNYV